MTKKLGIYIHIPFCIKKCNYCDFYSVSSDKKLKEAYVEAVKKEIEKVSAGLDGDEEVNTVYFGGGTPNILEPLKIKEILESVRDNFVVGKKEITIECNPVAVDEHKLEIYKECGINRISIGLQSANDNELKLLGRLHTYKEFLKTYDIVRKIGFINVSVDLMSGIPGQTVESYSHSVAEVIRLNPEHISSYSLIVEPGTEFFAKYSEGMPFENELPDEDTERRLYLYTVSEFEKHGYHRYEISNYAKNGFESRHNSSYWDRVPYLGFGAAASSFFDDMRWRNPSDIKRYIEGINRGEDIRENIEKLSEKDAMAETMFLGLRMNKGVGKALFSEKFGRNIYEVYGEVLNKHIKNGLLLDEGDKIRLSDRGIDVSNYVFCDFL